MAKSAIMKPHLFARRSVFLTGTIIIAICTAIVSTSLEVMSVRSSQSLVANGVRLHGLEVTKLIAQQVGGAIKFSKSEIFESLFSDAIAGSDGSALAAVALAADGNVIASTGEILVSDEQLNAAVSQAIENGETTLGNDGFLVVTPVRFGKNNDIVGAVAMQWSPKAAKADLLSAQRISLLIAGVLLIVVLVGAALLLRKLISRPLVSLRDAMEHVAAAEYGVDIPNLKRKDEIGAIARTLETFRDALSSAEEATRDGLFKGAAFEASTAAMMMIDGESRIQYLNGACAALLRDFQDYFAAGSPDFKVDELVGHPIRNLLNAEVFPDEVVSTEGELPYRTDICVGDMRINLTVDAVSDANGSRIGCVLEWKDVTEERLNKAALATIDANQIHVEFSVGGQLTMANDNFATALGVTVNDLDGIDLNDLFASYSGDGQESPIDMAALEDGETLVGRFLAKLADGEPGIFEGSVNRVDDTMGRALRLVFIGNDITQSLIEIEASEARRTAMEKAQEQVVSAFSIALSDLAKGNLTGRIDEVFTPEYEELRADFNEAMSHLLSAMRTVVESAEMIGNEARDISTAAEDLSQRTERQAATLEETAASIDELTASVKSASEGANRASDIANSAKENAQESEIVVQETVAAMGEIQNGSTEIAKIINVIEDIAFQTNLLALNAGVEAARAGESGRGFAVVASEVRALAQRSSEAAQEINALISKSGAQVKRGVGLVDRMGAALGEIVTSVSQITSHVTGIAESVQEQSGSLEEINAAMSQLDRVTQQNAAMFEETTAASHSLTSEARSLSDTTRKFKVDGDASAAVAEGDDAELPIAIAS